MKDAGLPRRRQAAEHAEIDPVSGAEINALLDRVYAAPTDLVARLRELAK